MLVEYNDNHGLSRINDERRIPSAVPLRPLALYVDPDFPGPGVRNIPVVVCRGYVQLSPTIR